ncbi:MAG: hypothetical protein J6X35_09550, partial [Bacteroidales bacterium]|nr:hypothetical protein [Bacteroidales bacterium]
LKIFGFQLFGIFHLVPFFLWDGHPVFSKPFLRCRKGDSHILEIVRFMQSGQETSESDFRRAKDTYFYHIHIF